MTRDPRPAFRSGLGHPSVNTQYPMKHATTDRRPRGATSYATVAGIVVCFISVSLAPALMKPPGWGREADPAARQGAAAENLFCRVGVKAPLPFLRCDAPAERFQRLRQAVSAGVGFDFLATCGDLMRSKYAKSSKPGVAENSKHKTGQAFDYNQEDRNVLIVREPEGGRTYWRTYLLCAKQDGGCGAKLDLETDNAGRVSAYVFDFTAAAESLGWGRIPAQEGWERSPTKKEFWHYELREGAETGGGDDGRPRRKKNLSPFVVPFRYLADLISPRKPKP